jgi:hypothetical protein
MKKLWFKSRYVGDILSGAKRDTVRARGPRLPLPGERVGLSVGPRPSFAEALIESVDAVAEVPAKRRREVELCYDGEMPSNPVGITFRTSSARKR